MTRVLAPLVRGSTYRRGVLLLLGGVIALPYALLAVVFVTMLTSDDVPRPATCRTRPGRRRDRRDAGVPGRHPRGGDRRRARAAGCRPARPRRPGRPGDHPARRPLVRACTWSSAACSASRCSPRCRWRLVFVLQSFAGDSIAARGPAVRRLESGCAHRGRDRPGGAARLRGRRARRARRATRTDPARSVAGGTDRHAGSPHRPTRRAHPAGPRTARLGRPRADRDHPAGGGRTAGAARPGVRPSRRWSRSRRPVGPRWTTSTTCSACSARPSAPTARRRCGRWPTSTGSSPTSAVPGCAWR